MAESKICCVKYKAIKITAFNPYVIQVINRHRLGNAITLSCGNAKNVLFTYDNQKYQ